AVRIPPVAAWVPTERLTARRRVQRPSPTHAIHHRAAVGGRPVGLPPEGVHLHMGRAQLARQGPAHGGLARSRGTDDHNPSHAASLSSSAVPYRQWSASTRSPTWSRACPRSPKASATACARGPL